ncbi:MAG: hypothetical protein JSW48_08345 [Betaproteobacteria bacterium]|jgi:hypothetical protein|nr:MAG: hypothetical protein JSW48_08345 [Betaproteobacteria bacterium]
MVDAGTRYRQAAFLVIAVVSLIMTLLLYVRGTVWLISALVSYIVLGLLIYWGNKRLHLVPFEQRQKPADST